MNEGRTRTRLRNSVSKQDVARALDQTSQTKPRRIKVRIISHRTRLLDSDNCTGGSKALTDALVKAGLLPGDSPELIDITVEQIKISKRSGRYTRIEIDYP